MNENQKLGLQIIEEWGFEDCLRCIGISLLKEEKISEDDITYAIEFLRKGRNSVSRKERSNSRDWNYWLKIIKDLYPTR